ncbi:hypothetical protein [Amycolatopsis sp. cg9]|uniref:hypothetical protein n=1 Tax=Amycolatopsis sp. cg9 TaxID=3238801 RepID=UPI0035251AAB
MSRATALAGVALVAAGLLTGAVTAAAAATGPAEVTLYTAEVTVTKVVPSRGTTGLRTVELVVVVTPVVVLRPALRRAHGGHGPNRVRNSPSLSMRLVSTSSAVR